MKYIFTLLLLSAIAYSMSSINKVRIDLELVHQQNTETSSPIIFEPGPVFDEIYDTPTPTITPTITPTETPTDKLILYILNHFTNDNTNPPSSFVINQNKQNQQNQQNQPNVLLPNPPIY